MKCLWLQLWGELLAPLCPPSPFLNTGGYNPAKAPPPARMRHRDTHSETAQPAQGTPICCDHQLCICRLQSLNKAILTQQSEPFSSSCTPKASATSTPWFLQLCRSSLQASPPHSWWGREHFTWLTPFLQSEGNHSKLLSQGSTSPSYTRNVAHQRGHLQETTLSSHPAASLCRQGSDVQGNTHISQAFSVQGRTKRFGSYCKLTSQALECQSPSTSSVQSQVWHDCGTAMPQHGHRYQKSGPILLPDEKLHKEASITFINGFWPGKGASSQQLETLSSCGWRAKDSFLTPPLNDTGVIWFIPHSTSACSSVSSGCGKGLVLCPSSQGTRLLKDPKPWRPRWYIFFHL